VSAKKMRLEPTGVQDASSDEASIYVKTVEGVECFAGRSPILGETTPSSV
jgi:hypothetical protein